jgi:hypothetical protein
MYITCETTSRITRYAYRARRKLTESVDLVDLVMVFWGTWRDAIRGLEWYYSRLTSLM